MSKKKKKLYCTARITETICGIIVFACFSRFQTFLNPGLQNISEKVMELLLDNVIINL